MEAINAAYKQMVEKKMLLGQDIVTADKDGNIRIESARECYERVYKRKK